MADKIVLIAVLACLGMFGLRGVLPDVIQDSSLSFVADLLLVLAAVVLAGVAFYEASIKSSADTKLNKTP
jgi:succinate dehydrogenase hydrophobic anchor subunit